MHLFHKAASLTGLAMLAGLSLAAAPAAEAQAKVVTLTGRLTFVDNSGGAFDSSVQVGTTFTYSFAVDPSERQTYSNVSPGNFAETRYDSLGALYGATVSYGGVTLTSDATSRNFMSRQNGYNSNYEDHLYQQSNAGAASGLVSGHTALFSDVYGFGAGGSHPTDLNDPTFGWDLTRYTGTQFESRAAGGGANNRVGGIITGFSMASASPAVVPEPSTVAAFGFTFLGTAGLMVKARRRKGLPAA